MPAKRRSPLWLRRSAAFVLLILVAGCGGGGDGGAEPGPQAVTYTGNTNPATISASNAGELSASATSSGSNVPSPTSSVAPAGETDGGDGFFSVGHRMARTIRSSLMAPTPGSPLMSIPVDKTEDCPNGGTRRVFGDISATGTGTLQAVYTNCDDGDGEIVSGTSTYRVDSVATVMGKRVPTDSTITFSPLAVRGAKNADLAGSVRFQVDIPNNSETVTENLVARQNSTGRMLKWENVRAVIVYDNISAPTSYTVLINGRIYDSMHGFVDIATTEPLVFSSLAQKRPNGGQLVLTGANNARVRITVLSATLVELQLDRDGTGGFETTAFITWTGLSGPQCADIADNDGDGMHNSWESAFGLNASMNDAAGDKDGDGVTNLAEYRAGTTP